VAGLHEDAVVVDLHNDLPVMLTQYQYRWGRETFFRDWVVPELRTGGVNVQVMPVYVEPEYAEASLRRVLLTIEQIHRDAEANPDAVALCRAGAEIDAALTAGKLALVLALEGCAALGADLALFGLMHRLGVRIASFTHFPRTLWADGSPDEGAGARLPALGVAAVGELERLGILVDVSHLASPAIDHVLEIATRPVIATHSSARALRDHHRNLTDAQLRRIAATGGVAGVNVIPEFIHADARQATLDHVVDHVLHMADVAGIDHVALGPDFIADLYEAEYPHLPEVLFEGVNLKQTIPGLAGSRDLTNLTDALLRRGLGESDVRKVLGENALRLLRSAL
jgi:membrane dipeptidase